MVWISYRLCYVNDQYRTVTPTTSHLRHEVVDSVSAKNKISAHLRSKSISKPILSGTMMSALSKRPTYTRPQLSQWLNLINQTGSPMSLEDLEADIMSCPLATLRRMQLWQLAAVPFGNLVLHYSAHHVVSLDTETLFTKIVERRLGGYCMENNAFFATVLRSLGYDLYTAGARVSNAISTSREDPEGYSGWSHMLIIVTIHGQRYMVDVGFGTSGAIQPIRLRDRETVPSIPTSKACLVYKSIAPCTDPNQRMWIFEVQNTADSPWIPQYCFSELEFLPQDFMVMNHHVSQSRTSWFTQTLVFTKLLLDHHREMAVGNLTLSGTELKRRLNGYSETLVTCKTEEERVQVLERYFDAKLRLDEIRGIRGLPSEIKPPS
jgi:arylamine N-acetyltransferase